MKILHAIMTMHILFLLQFSLILCVCVSIFFSLCFCYFYSFVSIVTTVARNILRRIKNILSFFFFFYDYFGNWPNNSIIILGKKYMLILNMVCTMWNELGVMTVSRKVSTKCAQKTGKLFQKMELQKIVCVSSAFDSI